MDPHLTMHRDLQGDGYTIPQPAYVVRREKRDEIRRCSSDRILNHAEKTVAWITKDMS